MPLSTLQTTPHGVARKTRGQDGFATSFPVRLFHPLQHAGSSRRSPNRRLTTRNRIGLRPKNLRQIEVREFVSVIRWRGRLRWDRLSFRVASEIAA